MRKIVGRPAVEHGDKHPTRGDAECLGQHGCGIIDEFEHVEQRHIVERIVLEGKMVAHAKVEVGARPEARPCRGQHVGAGVEARHVEAAFPEVLEKDAGAAAHIEQRMPAARPSRDEMLQETALMP